MKVERQNLEKEIEDLLRESLGNPHQFQLKEIFEKYDGNSKLTWNEFNDIKDRIDEGIDYETLKKQKAEFLGENDGIKVRLLGEDVYSFKRLAYLLFYNPKKAKELLDEPEFIGNALSQSGDLDFTSEITNALKDESKFKTEKYLKVLYKLNPELPFRFILDWFRPVTDEELIYNPDPDLFEKIKKTYKNFNLGYKIYRSGYVHIWLQNAYDKPPVNYAIKQDQQTDYQKFLHFLYKNKEDMPFFLNEKTSFASFKDMVDYLESGMENYEEVKAELYQGDLMIWLENQKDYFNELKKWKKSYFKEEDFNKTDYDQDYAIEKLLQDVYGMEKPQIECNPHDIDLGDIPKDQIQIFSLEITLKNRGFLSGEIIDGDLPGKSINVVEQVLSDFNHDLEEVEKENENLQEESEEEGKTFKLRKFKNKDSAHFIKLKLNPSHFDFGHPYHKTLLIDTSEGKYKVPLNFNVNFPRQYFTIELLKWAGSFALLLFIARLIIIGAYSSPLVLNSSLEKGFIAFCLAFTLLLVGLISIIYLRMVFNSFDDYLKDKALQE